MIVSAISANGGQVYNFSRNNSYINSVEEPKEDVFNSSVTSYKSSKKVKADKLPLVLDSIAQWQKFCHSQILGKNLDIIA